MSAATFGGVAVVVVWALVIGFWVLAILRQRRARSRAAGERMERLLRDASAELFDKVEKRPEGEA